MEVVVVVVVVVGASSNSLREFLGKLSPAVGDCVAVRGLGGESVQEVQEVQDLCIRFDGYQY